MPLRALRSAQLQFVQIALKSVSPSLYVMPLAMGRVEDADPNYFVVHDGKLLLQRNEKAHIMFAKDLDGNHKKADANWAKLQEEAF